MHGRLYIISCVHDRLIYYSVVQMTFEDYVHRIMKPQTPGQLGKGNDICVLLSNGWINATFSDTLYHFGDNDRNAWDPLFSLYNLPPYALPGMEPVISFGLAGKEGKRQNILFIASYSRSSKVPELVSPFIYTDPHSPKPFTEERYTRTHTL